MLGYSGTVWLYKTLWYFYHCNNQSDYNTFEMVRVQTCVCISLFFLFCFFCQIIDSMSITHHQTEMRWGANGTFECASVSVSLWITDLSLCLNFDVLASHTRTATLPVICFWATAHLCQWWPNLPQWHSSFKTFRILLIIEDRIASLILLVTWFTWKEWTQTDKVLNPRHKFIMFFFF